MLCFLTQWLQKADVDINAKVSMILGDCVLLGESGLDADVGNLEMRRRSRHDRPCAVLVIWGGWPW